MLEKAKQDGQRELLGRRERLMLELEKLGQRTEEFAEFSELDMVQQVNKPKQSFVVSPTKEVL